MTTLAERLENNIHRFSSTDPEWVKFVKDHRFNLLNQSVRHRVDPNKMHFGQYRIDKILRDLGSSASIGWIVMWLNQLSGNRELTGLKTLLVPPQNVIEQLYSDYQVYKTTLG